MEQASGHWEEWRNAVADLLVLKWGFGPDVSLSIAEHQRVRSLHDRGYTPEQAVKAEILAQSLEL